MTETLGEFRYVIIENALAAVRAAETGANAQTANQEWHHPTTAAPTHHERIRQ
jgi:hypothetical protein